MRAQSRTSKSIKNSIVALIFYAINLIIQFYSRKIFLDYLGSEIIGLNTTAVNLLQFLNLAELGINFAVGFTLYKPLHDNDTTTINEIITLQKYLYKRIGIFIASGALILMCFFHNIFSKMALPLWYAYASFGVLLFSALLGYFVNYRQIILTASQQDYKIIYSYKSVMILKVAIQMIAVWKSDYGYIWWLVLEVLFAVIASTTLNLETKNTFPKLKTSQNSYYILKSKYPDLTTKIKQLFFHKIGGFALTQSSPIIIYAYASLNIVTLYGNYIIITSGIQGMVNAIFNSMGAGIGNLVAEGNYAKIIEVFKELFSIRFLVSATLCYCTYSLTPAFITIWIGSQYILPESTLMLVTALLFISISRTTIDNYINAYGLYSDVWSPLVEAVLNISMSIVLGYYYGLNGIISGVLISQIIIVVMWKPYYLFTKRLQNYFWDYWKNYTIHIVLGLSTILITKYIVSKLVLMNDTINDSFIYLAVTHAITFMILLYVIMYIFCPGIRLFNNRIFHSRTFQRDKKQH